MELVTTFAVFIILVILGSYLNTKVPRIPAALFQIILGFFVTFLPIHLHFEFESEMFMAMVIAPLLFVDGYKASRANLWLYKKPILYMAIVLVIVTVVVVGSFINFIIPAISLPAAFALAAILSPTDAVAVKSITKGMKLPKGLMAILEGESLLNDAAGLVSFQIALAAIITGTFSLRSATTNFLVAALGGAILGLIIGIAMVRLKVTFRTMLDNEVSILVVVQLIAPIIIYFVAEHIHVSGIIAVVIAAIILNFERDLFQREAIGSEAAISVESTQSTFSYVLNGFVFVFLGYLLPDIFQNMRNFKELSMNTALIYVLLITIALMITRFLFVYFFYVQFQQHSFKSAKKIIKFFKERRLDVGNYTRFEYSAIASLCGIHGTVTLATALMIPLVLPSGEDFPLRDVILFVGSGVVLLSMVIGTIFLPLVIKSTEEEEHVEQRAIREYVIKETLKEVKDSHKESDDSKKEIAYAMVIRKLQEQQVWYSQDGRFFTKEIQTIYKEIYRRQNIAIKNVTERHNNNKTLEGILKLTQLRIYKLVTYSITKQILIQFKLSFGEAMFKRIRATHSILRENPNAFGNDRRAQRNAELRENFNSIRSILPTVSKELTELAVLTAEEMRTEQNSLAVDFLIDSYKNFAATNYYVYILDENFDEEIRTLQMEAIQLQKYRIMTMKKLGHIHSHDADTILRDLNYNEALLFSYEEEE